jgi:hypothetical protein
MFAQTWAIVYFGHYRSGSKIWATLFHRKGCVLILTENILGDFFCPIIYLVALAANTRFRVASRKIRSVAHRCFHKL